MDLAAGAGSKGAIGEVLTLLRSGTANAHQFLGGNSWAIILTSFRSLCHKALSKLISISVHYRGLKKNDYLARLGPGHRAAMARITAFASSSWPGGGSSLVGMSSVASARHASTCLGGISISPVWLILGRGRGGGNYLKTPSDAASGCDAG